MKKVLISLLLFVFVIVTKGQDVVVKKGKNSKDTFKPYLKPKFADTVFINSFEKKEVGDKNKYFVYIVNGTEYKVAEIESYRNETGWFHNIENNLIAPNYGSKIMVFTKQFTSTSYSPPSPNSIGAGSLRTYSSTMYFLKKAGQDKTELYDLNKNVLGWLKDNDEAYEVAKSSLRITKNADRYRWINALSYVGAALIGSNFGKGDSQSPSKGQIIASATLFVGGLANMGINVFYRRKKASRKFDEAIDIYNSTPEPRRK